MAGNTDYLYLLLFMSKKGISSVLLAVGKKVLLAFWVSFEVEIAWGWW